MEECMLEMNDILIQQQSLVPSIQILKVAMHTMFMGSG